MAVSFYADAGYFAEMLSDQSQLKTFPIGLYRSTSATGDAALAHRLMYGTDCDMIIQLGRRSGDYLARFEALFSELEGDSTLCVDGRLSDRFFGINAANFLGLGPLQATRDRLDQWLGLGPKPAWMAKFDGIHPVTA